MITDYDGGDDSGDNSPEFGVLHSVSTHIHALICIVVCYSFVFSLPLSVFKFVLNISTLRI